MSATATSRIQKKKTSERSKAITSSARTRQGKSKVIPTLDELQKQFPQLLKFTKNLARKRQITMRWGTDIWTFMMIKESQTKGNLPSGYDVEPSQLDRFSHAVRKKIATARKAGKLKTFKGDIEALLDG